MIISTQYKFIFFCNGKTGTTSIEQILSKYHDGDEILFKVVGYPEYINNVPQKVVKHCPPYIVKDILQERYNDFFSFIFVRNPYDWLISQIFHNFLNAREFVSKLDLNLLSNIVEILANYRCFAEDQTLYQYQYLLDKEGNRIVNYVGRFETLEKDWKFICSTIGLPYESLPILNRNKKKQYKFYYQNEQIQDIVCRIYEKDFEYLGYPKEL